MKYITIILFFSLFYLSATAQCGDNSPEPAKRKSFRSMPKDKKAEIFAAKNKLHSIRRTFSGGEAVAVEDTLGRWKGFVICKEAGDTTYIFKEFDPIIDMTLVIDITANDSLYAVLSINMVGVIQYVLWKYSENTIKILQSTTLSFYNVNPAIQVKAHLLHPRIVNISYDNHITTPRPGSRYTLFKDYFVYFEMDSQKPATILGLETPIVVENKNIFNELSIIMYK